MTTIYLREAPAKHPPRVVGGELRLAPMPLRIARSLQLLATDRRPPTGERTRNRGYSQVDDGPVVDGGP